MLLDAAEDAEPVGHLVADERRVGRADLGVVEVVVALAIGDVAGQRLGQLVARVLVDEVDDVVRDERREPARPLAPDLARADVRRGGRLDLDRRPGRGPAATAASRTWATNQRMRSGSASWRMIPSATRPVIARAIGP